MKLTYALLRKQRTPNLRYIVRTLLMKLAPGHHLISSRYLRLKYVWFSSDWHPYPPLPFKHFKGFPSSAICPSRVRHGGHFYHSNSMRVLFSWTQLGPEHEINLRGTPYELGTYDRCDQRRLRRALCVCTICSLTKFKVDEDSSQIKFLDIYVHWF